MDFCSGQGANHSNSPAIARICNAAMGKKTRFYVPDSVQHHTGLEVMGYFQLTSFPCPQERLMGSTEQTTQTHQTHQTHQPDQSRQTAHTNQSDSQEKQANHPQAGNASLHQVQARSHRDSGQPKRGGPSVNHFHALESPGGFRDSRANRESPMDPREEMDLTSYLQTEGRRRAAELAGSRRPGNPGLPAPSPQAQQQCAKPASDQQPPQSLSEALRRMGVV